MDLWPATAGMRVIHLSASGAGPGALLLKSSNAQMFNFYTAAITFNSTEIGVGRESTPTVVRVGWISPKYSV